MDLNPYNAPTSATTDHSDSPLDVADSPARVRSPFKIAWIAVVVWQLVCLAMLYMYHRFVVQLWVAAYIAINGDIQANYGTFARIATNLEAFVVTLPATIATMVLVDKLSASKALPRRRLLTASCWQLMTMIVLAASYEFSFSSMIAEFLGPPIDTYSFQSLVLHNLIAWLLCTLPITWLAVWTYLRAQGWQLVHEQSGDRHV